MVDEAMRIERNIILAVPVFFLRLNPRASGPFLLSFNHV